MKKTIYNKYVTIIDYRENLQLSLIVFFLQQEFFYVK